jgi:thioredoxin 1
MAIQQPDEASLRHLLPELPKAVVMFTASNCATCEQLQPLFELFATNQAYAGITFLQLNADRYPEARALMHHQKAPFFGSYCHGHVVYGDTLHTEHQVRALLNALVAHF